MVVLVGTGRGDQVRRSAAGCSGHGTPGSSGRSRRRPVGTPERLRALRDQA